MQTIYRSETKSYSVNANVGNYVNVLGQIKTDIPKVRDNIENFRKSNFDNDLLKYGNKAYFIVNEPQGVVGQACQEQNGNLWVPDSQDEFRFVITYMSNKSIDKFPVHVVAKGNSYYFENGKFFTNLTDAERNDSHKNAINGAIPFVTKDQNLEAAASSGSATAVQVLCQRPLQIGERSKAWHHYVDNVINKLEPILDRVKPIIDVGSEIHNSGPTALLQASNVIKVFPTKELMIINDTLHKMAVKANWKNAALAFKSIKEVTKILNKYFSKNRGQNIPLEFNKSERQSLKTALDLPATTKVMSQMYLKPMKQSDAAGDALVQGNLVMEESEKSEKFEIFEVYPYVLKNGLPTAKYLVKSDKITFVTNDYDYLLNDCKENDEKFSICSFPMPMVPIKYQQCAKYLIDGDGANPCQLNSNIHSVAYRCQCHSGSNFVVSTNKEINPHIVCNGQFAGYLKLSIGNKFLSSTCELKLDGMTFLQPIDNAEEYVPPKRTTVEVQSQTLSDQNMKILVSVVASLFFIIFSSYFWKCFSKWKARRLAARQEAADKDEERESLKKENVELKENNRLLSRSTSMANLNNDPNSSSAPSQASAPPKA